MPSEVSEPRWRSFPLDRGAIPRSAGKIRPSRRGKLPFVTGIRDVPGPGAGCTLCEGDGEPRPEATSWGQSLSEHAIETDDRVHHGVGRPDPDRVPLRPVPLRLTVMLADDQPAIRRGVRAVLERSGNVVVVGEAAEPGEVIEHVARLQPDVLVTGLRPDDPATVRLIERVSHLAPGTGVLVFTAIDDEAVVRSVLHAGALGYLRTDADGSQIVRAVRAVGAGEVTVGRTVARRVSSWLGAGGGPDRYPFPELTTREREVLDLLAAGKSNTVIAKELSLASKTGSNRVSAVLDKLGVADRAQAIVLARETGLGRG